MVIQQRKQIRKDSRQQLNFQMQALSSGNLRLSRRFPQLAPRWSAHPYSPIRI